MWAKGEDGKIEVESAQLWGAAFEVFAGSLRGFVGQAAAQCHHPHRGQLLAMRQGEPWGASLRGKSEVKSSGEMRDVYMPGLLPCQRPPSARIRESDVRLATWQRNAALSSRGYRSF
jgi:hypothetical protein